MKMPEIYQNYYFRAWTEPVFLIKKNSRLFNELRNDQKQFIFVELDLKRPHFDPKWDHGTRKYYFIGFNLKINLPQGLINKIKTSRILKFTFWYFYFYLYLVWIPRNFQFFIFR